MGRIRTISSWIVVVTGLAVGMWALVTFGMDWVDFDDPLPGWFLRLFSMAGMGLFGLGFTLSSLAALRNRKRGGILFLAFMPVAAFFLGYPNAGYLEWHADGGGYFESPLPLTAIVLSALFFAPFLVLLLALRRRKLAAYLFVASACLLWILLGRSYWGNVLVPKLAEWSAPLIRGRCDGDNHSVEVITFQHAIQSICATVRRDSCADLP